MYHGKPKRVSEGYLVDGRTSPAQALLQTAFASIMVLLPDRPG